MPNTILKRWTGSAFEELYPKTTVSQISATGSPGSTTALFGDASWKTTPAGSGSTNQIAYWTGTTTVGALTTASYPSLTELSYVKGVTSAIQTQLNNLNFTYRTSKVTQQTNATTTPATYHTITLPHSGYYSITVYGMWSKTTTTNLVGNVISVITDDATGTPKFDGAFEWQQTTTASAFTTENNSINIPTSGTSLGITTQTATQSRTETYWCMKGLLYTGTTNDKTLSFQFACSTAPGTGSVALEKIAIVATKVG